MKRFIFENNFLNCFCMRILHSKKMSEGMDDKYVSNKSSLYNDVGYLSTRSVFKQATIEYEERLNTLLNDICEKYYLSIEPFIHEFMNSKTEPYDGVPFTLHPVIKELLLTYKKKHPHSSQ